MAKKAMNSRKVKVNNDLMYCVERLAMCVPNTEDLFLLEASDEELEAHINTHCKKNNIIGGSFMNEKKSSNKSQLSECAITKVLSDNAEAILSKVAVVNVILTNNKRSESDMLAGYAKEITTALRELSSGVMEYCKKSNDYSVKDSLFSEVATDYLNNFEINVLEVVAIQQLVAIGENVDSINATDKEDLVASIVEIYNISAELMRRQYMATQPVSEKQLALFNKLNDALPTALQVAEPTNALACSDVIPQLLALPTSNMLNKVFKMLAELGQNPNMAELQEKPRSEISELIKELEELFPASEKQLNFLASVLKQLDKPYVAEQYDRMNSAECSRVINGLNAELLVKLSGGVYTLDQAKKLSYTELNNLIQKFRSEARRGYHDNDTKDKLGSILEKFALNSKEIKNGVI